MYKPTAKTYFSGAGLMDLGLLESGINVLESFEIDKHCCDTQRKNFSHKVNESDITKITVTDQQDADIYAFTFPCTKYSTIADIHQTRTGDELFLHALRHLALKQPEAYLVENVPGMKKFPIVMEATSKLPGYYVNIFCPIDSKNWLPQKRERLIIFGTKKNFMISPPQIYRPVKLSEIFESCPEMEIPEYVLSRINGNYRDKPIISDPAKNDIAPTCVAHYAKDRGTRMIVDKTHPLGIRPYTVKEYARLLGVPDWFKFSGSDSDAYRQIGNGVAVNVAEWCGKELMRYFN